MKKTIQTVVGVLATLIVTASSCMTAAADTRDTDYTREEIVDEYWTEIWSNSDPGEVNPEGSLEYYILQCFLDEQYGTYDMVSDWSNYHSIRYAWQDYHEEYTMYWDYEDDEETGEFTIRSYDPKTDEYGDTLYTFELIDGMWNMIDTNSNSVLTFEPHGGDGSYSALVDALENSEIDMEYDINGYVNNGDSILYEGDDDQSENDQSSSASSTTVNDNYSGSRVTGTAAEASASNESSEITEETVSESEETSHTAVYVVGGVVVVGVITGYVIYKKKK